jgi:Flp pilus assembly protein TadB
MPLSEEENRILRQIEEQLQADHSFALKVSQHRPDATSRRRLVVSVAVLVALLVVLIVSLQVSAWVSFGAFIGMVLAGVALERELHARGRQQLHRIPDELRRRAAGRSSGDTDLT